jgi:enoyl-[acyl-carrier-protein] reductase (NADH)
MRALVPGERELLRDQRRPRSLLKTEGTRWDVGTGVLYLVSDEARWVTGIVLPIDAGATAAAGLPGRRAVVGATKTMMPPLVG